MRRIFFLFLSLALLALTIPAAAMPVSDLTALAQYFPDKTVMFSSIRTDDAFLDELDALWGIVQSRVPEAPPFSVRDVLDQALSSNSTLALTGGFDESIRTWLGDTAAIGLPTAGTMFAEETSAQSEYLVAIEVTDQNAAVAFFEAIMPSDSEIEVEDGYHLIRFGQDLPEGLPGGIYIDDSVMVITTITALLPQNNVSPSLLESDTFNASVNALPAPDYNALFYINLPEIFASLPTDEFDEVDAATLQVFEMLQNSFGGIALGATVIEGRALTLDIAEILTDLSIYESMGVSSPADYPAISYDFAQYVPAETPLYFQGTDLRGLYENGIASFRASIALDDTPAVEGGLTPSEELESGLEQLEFAVNTLTQSDLQDDILSWMTGNFGLALDFSPAVADYDSMLEVTAAMPLDFSLLIEATDPEAAQAFVDGLTRSLSLFGEDSATVETETIGDTVAQIVQIPPSDDVPFPIEIGFGASENVFVVGTPRMLRAALNPDGGLASDPHYQDMQISALPNTQVLYYLSGATLEPLVRLLVLSRSVNAQDEAAIVNIFSLIDNASLTYNVQESGVILGRMVITLPDSE